MCISHYETAHVWVSRPRTIETKKLYHKEMRKVTLILDNGTRFQGWSFGYEKPVVGEVVFNTAMAGYPESLTDPSYAGQLMTLTYPLVGNYGVPPFTCAKNGIQNFMESGKIYPEALIVSDYSENYSHWNAVESLGDWLKREHIPGVTGIDTRELTKTLRERGVMMGRLAFDEDEEQIEGYKFPAYDAVNYVDLVSCKEVMIYAGDECTHVSAYAPHEEVNKAIETMRGGRKRVVLMDCGVKANILRSLIKRDVELIRVPWNYDFNNLLFDGLFISNGPGDPNNCGAAVENIRTAMQNSTLPIFGICMGNQLLGKAAGANIYKLKYGHRSQNQPVRKVGTTQCFITSQNHGYAVDNNTLTGEWKPLFVNMNDGSNEGIENTEHPWYSVQFHPEACGGPTDTLFMFDDFVGMLH